MKTLSCFKITTALLSLVLQCVTDAVKINKLIVPSVISHDAPVVLDCDFTLEPTDQGGLVVKWYFTKNETLVYQWIPGRKPSQGSGIHKDRLNLEYEIGGDANTRHRALHILKPGPDLSGDYTCSVSTFQSEDKRTKSMLVFVPGKSLKLIRLPSEDGVMHVQCSAEGIFPRPVMTLRSQEREITVNTTVGEKDKLFEISVAAVLPALEDSEEFTCELHIPEANHTERKSVVFYPVQRNFEKHKRFTLDQGNDGSFVVNTRWLAIANCVFSLWICLGNTSLGLL